MIKGASCIAIISMALLASRDASANAYDMPDHGAEALGRAGAFVAKADSPWALYYNPAGAARLRGTHISIGSNFLAATARYQRLHFGDPTQPVDRYPHDSNLRMPEVVSTQGPIALPALMITTDLGGLLRELDLVLLAGIYGPHAAGDMLFPRFCKAGVSPCQASGPDGIPNPARLDMVSREVLVFYPSIGLAWQPFSGLSIGAVFQLTHMAFRYHLVVGAFVGEAPENDVDVRLDLSSALTATGILGIHYQPFDFLQIGASARIGHTVKTTGTVATALGPGLAKGSALSLETTPNPAPGELDIPFPWIFRFGVHYVHKDCEDKERFDVELDATYETLSTLDTFALKSHIQLVNTETGNQFLQTITDVPVPHRWRNSFSLRLGGSVSFHDIIAKSVLVLRAGALYESSAMPDELTRLDFLSLTRLGFTLGFGLRYGRYGLDFGYGFFSHLRRSISPEQTVGQCGPIPKAGCGSQVTSLVPISPIKIGGPVGNGTYDMTAHIFSVSGRVRVW
jgi:long-chain fatty acid transport protein